MSLSQWERCGVLCGVSDNFIIFLSSQDVPIPYTGPLDCGFNIPRLFMVKEALLVMTAEPVAKFTCSTGSSRSCCYLVDFHPCRHLV
ncbi:hypothetical protein NMG60_11003276 [Bertholletia excelsa]